jgi:hypothetical protein
MVIGNLMQFAALNLKQKLISAQLLEPEYTAQQFQIACRNYIQSIGPLKTTA